MRGFIIATKVDGNKQIISVDSISNIAENDRGCTIYLRNTEHYFIVIESIVDLVEKLENAE